MTMGDPNKMKSGAPYPPKSGQGTSGAQSGGTANKSDTQKSNMDFILDIPLEISVELGRTTLMINDLLKLGQGSVVELSKIAGETLEVLANHRLIARGEVVVINEKYGIRLTEIISPMERIERLR
ncbi:MAG: flagellar motor switch protein FliN [Pseudomonadota bacterium]